MKRGNAARKKYSVAPLKKMVGPLAPTRYQSGIGVSVQSVILIALMSFLIGLALATYAPVLMRHFGMELKQVHLDMKVVNLTHVPSLEDLTGLWTAKYMGVRSAILCTPARSWLGCKSIN